MFVAGAYWYLYLTGEGAVDIDFNIGSLSSAMEAGGPMGRMRSKNQPMPNAHNDSESDEGKVIEGQEPANGGNPVQLPHSGGYMTSGISKELDPNIYAKSKAEKMDEEKAANGA